MEHKFRAIGVSNKTWVEGYYAKKYSCDGKDVHLILSTENVKEFVINVNSEVIPETVGMYTGYKMFDKEVYVGHLVSNNYKTDREVIREIVLHEGCLMMKRVKGNSRLPKHILLHEWHALNFKVTGTIHDRHLKAK